MSASTRRLRVFCLDVGQGDCTFILPPDGAPPILFDCRDAHVARMFVRNRRPPITHLSAVVFSHLDADHIAGGEQFIKEFTMDGTIERVFIEPDRKLSEGAADHKIINALLDTLKSMEAYGVFELLTPRAEPAELDRSRAERDWSVRIVAPTQRVFLDIAQGEVRDAPNVRSAVVRAEFGGKAVVVGGDAPLVSWANMTRADQRAEVFRVPHHGGALSDGGIPPGWSAKKLFDEVGPELGVISVGTRNGYGHPDPTWVDPLFTRPGCSTVCTQLTPRCEPVVGTDPGAAAFRDENLPDTEYAEPAWRHRRDGRASGSSLPRFEVPCAGTIEIVLHEDGRIERIPFEGSRHTSRVIARVAQPRCQPHPNAWKHLLDEDPF